MVVSFITLIMLLLASGCENTAKTEVVVTPVPVTYVVQMDIDCAENLLFNKYDVTVEIDQEEIGVIDHGIQRTIEVLLEEGEYILSFQKEGDSNVDGEIQLFVDKNMYYKFYITCDSQQVKVNLIEETNLADKNKVTESNYTVAYVMECLKHVPSITAIEVDNTNHDEFSGLDSCLASIFFSSSLVNQEEVYGETVLEKGTAGGGSIDVFLNNEDALDRNEYLSRYDNTILQAGTHVVVDSLVIRLSIELDEESHKELFDNIVDTITSGTVQVPSEYNPTWVADGFGTSTLILTPRPNSTPPPSPIPTPTPEPTPEPKKEALYYSTNTRETVDDGDSGVYAYKSRGGSYDIYWLIDFDQDYVYYFTDGNGNEICDRLKIDSGDLNSAVTITYHDGSDSWSYKLHFKYVDNPEHLIMNDNFGYSYDYYTTSLDKALSIRDSKKIKDY